MSNEKTHRLTKDLRKSGLAGPIKDVEEAHEYVFVHGWVVDPEQGINPGQINSPNNNATYYDAETGKIETV